jgi:3-keto-5-aminohexanoate cleavage enzyme
MPALPAGPAPGVQPVVTPETSGAPLILTAALVGAEVTRAHTPYLPLTPAEVADEAARCREAGAAVLHLHARNDDGTSTQSADRFGEILTRVREKTDCILQVTTGGAVGMSLEERAGSLKCSPEMATLNCGTINFGDDVFVNTRKDIRDLAARIRASGAVAELECYEVGHIDEALTLHKEGLLGTPLHFQFVLGVPGAAAAREELVPFMARMLPAGSTWGVAAVGRYQRPMTELAMRLGGHARVGLEDNIYLEKGVLAEGSAPLVARAAAYGRSIGRQVTTPDEARRLLALPARG